MASEQERRRQERIRITTGIADWMRRNNLMLVNLLACPEASSVVPWARKVAPQVQAGRLFRDPIDPDRVAADTDADKTFRICAREIVRLFAETGYDVEAVVGLVPQGAVKKTLDALDAEACSCVIERLLRYLPLVLGILVVSAYLFDLENSRLNELVVAFPGLEHLI